MPDTDRPTTQTARSERTKTALLDATLEVLATEGMARATTHRICEVAGVSRGAQTHHYPTKNALVVAALVHMAERHADTSRQLVEQLDPDARTIDVVVSCLWDAVLDERFGFSALEALVHARTDPDLRPAVVDANATAIESVRSFAPTIVHRSASVDELADALESTLHYFRGLALSHALTQVDGAAVVGAWLDMLERRLGPPGLED